MTASVLGGFAEESNFGRKMQGMLISQLVSAGICQALDVGECHKKTPLSEQ